MILMNAKKFLSYITVMCVVISIGMLVGCKSNDSADLVVYGKIFTSEGGQIVEAFAVKEWPLYDLRDKRVMVLDEFNIHSEKESQIKITDWERTYFLSKYYSF